MDMTLRTIYGVISYLWSQSGGRWRYQVQVTHLRVMQREFAHARFYKINELHYKYLRKNIMA